MKEGFWTKVAGVTALIGLLITIYTLFHSPPSPAPGIAGRTEEGTKPPGTSLPVSATNPFKGYFNDRTDLNGDGVDELLYKQCPKESYNACHVYVYEKSGESWQEIGDLTGDIVGYPITAKSDGYGAIKTNGYRDISVRDGRWNIHDPKERKLDRLYKWDGNSYVEVGTN